MHTMGEYYGVELPDFALNKGSLFRMFWQTQKVILQNYDIVYVNDFYLQTRYIQNNFYKRLVRRIFSKV